MSSSSRFRWFIAAALVFGIGWKIVVPLDNPSHLRENLVDFLQRNHYKVVVTNEAINNTPIIRATSASCVLQVASLTSDGSNRDLIRDRAAGTDRSFVVFRGEIYPEQPIFRTTLNYFWFRFLRELGLVRHIPAVIDVAETASCHAERLAWDEL